MKKDEAWDRLKEIMKQDINCSGEMMSMAEHTWTVISAEYYLRIMERLEKDEGN